MSIDPARQLTTAELDRVALANGRPASTVAGRLLSVSFLLRALRRRWKVWTTTAVAGMLIGAATSLAVPPQPSAATTILLRHPTGTDPTRAMATDRALIMTSAVASDAVARMGPGMEVGGLSYEVTSLSDNLMQITAQGPDGPAAVRLADAVAAAFFDFRRNQFEQQAQAVARALQDRQRALNDELSVVAARINELQPAGQPAGAATETGTLGDLFARRTTINDQLTQIRQQSGNALIDRESVLASSSVIEPASEFTPSEKRALRFNVAAGLVAGIAAGAAWVVLWAAVSDRVRRREEVAAALHAPVAVSIGRVSRSRRAWSRSFWRHPAEPGRELRRIIRHLARLVSSDDTAERRLLLVSLDSDGPTSAAIAHLAVELTSKGRRVVVADLSTGSVLARFLKAPTGTTATVDLPDAGSTLQVTCPPPEALEAPHDQDSTVTSLLRNEADVVLSMATLDPGLGAWHLSDWASVAVVVVTVGRSSEDVLRSACRMLRAASLEVHSVILVGADGDDETVGLLGGHLAPLGAAPLSSTR